MSDSLQERWPEPEAPYAEHERALFEGIAVIGRRMVLPEDDRFELVYTANVAGAGPDASAVAVDDPGTGKTTYGDMLFGVDKRVEIDKKDSVATLFGHVNPIDASEIIPGKLGIGLSNGNPVGYFNEISHMKDNPGPLGRLFDSDVVKVNGHDVSLSNMAIYGTANFPDNNRSHPLNAALRSRFGAMILTGDHSEADAELIHQKASMMEGADLPTPILPTAEVRRAVGEYVAQRYPVGKHTGRFIVDLVNNLNASGLVEPVNKGDARFGKSLLHYAQSAMFLNQERDNGMVTPKHLAVVAALVLPTIVQLNYTAKAKLQEAVSRRSSKFEEAIAVRRVIARTAFATVTEGELLPEDKKFDKAVDEYSYANANAVNFDVDQALFGGKPAANIAAEVEEPQRGKRSRFGRRAK